MLRNSGTRVPSLPLKEIHIYTQQYVLVYRKCRKNRKERKITCVSPTPWHLLSFPGSWGDGFCLYQFKLLAS